MQALEQFIRIGDDWEILCVASENFPNDEVDEVVGGEVEGQLVMQVGRPFARAHALHRRGRPCLPISAVALGDDTARLVPDPLRDQQDAVEVEHHRLDHGREYRNTDE